MTKELHVNFYQKSKYQKTLKYAYVSYLFYEVHAYIFLKEDKDFYR